MIALEKSKVVRVKDVDGKVITFRYAITQDGLMMKSADAENYEGPCDWLRLYVLCCQHTPKRRTK